MNVTLALSNITKIKIVTLGAHQSCMEATLVNQKSNSHWKVSPVLYVDSPIVPVSQLFEPAVIFFFFSINCLAKRESDSHPQ